MFYNILGFLVLVAAVLGGLVWHYRRTALYLGRQHEEFRKQRDAAVDLLNRIGLSINATLDLDGALETIAEYIVESTGAESGAIFLLDAQGKTLRARTVHGLFPPMHQTTGYVLTKQKYLEEKIKRDQVAVGEGIIGFVAKAGESLLISDALSDPRVPKTSLDFVQVRSMMAAPLRTRQRILGVFAVANKKGRGVFADEDLRLLEQLAVQAALTVDIVRLYEHQAAQRRIAQELELAQEFQQMLLPSALPRVRGLDIAGFSKPAQEVGGDYYDVFWVLPPEYLGVVIVDVAGKGIPGALVMAILRSVLKAEAPGSTSPREVLKRVNRRILEDTKDNVFITVLYGIINVPARRMRIVRAGHEPLIVCGASDEPQVCMPSGIALGMVGDEMFDVLEEREIDLKEGDTAILYTDGVIEAANAQWEEFGSERFLAGVKGRVSQPAQRQIDGILEDIQRFTGGIPQQDDITLVAVRVGDDAGQEASSFSDRVPEPDRV
jgi:sigma-B regulation protein RsbU (phosphoserine phosphatase)